MDGSQRVLLVEADYGHAEQVRGSLSVFNLDVEIVGEGAQALTRAKEDPPALILLCVELPKMSGYSICNKLKKHQALRDVPLVIMSSEATPDIFEQHRKLKTRAEGYLIKPFDMNELLELIRPMLRTDVHAGDLDDTGQNATLQDADLEATSLLDQQPAVDLIAAQTPEVSGDDIHIDTDDLDGEPYGDDPTRVSYENPGMMHSGASDVEEDTNVGTQAGTDVADETMGGGFDASIDFETDAAFARLEMGGVELEPGGDDADSGVFQTAAEAAQQGIEGAEAVADHSADAIELDDVDDHTPMDVQSPAEAAQSLAPPPPPPPPPPAAIALPPEVEDDLLATVPEDAMATVRNDVLSPGATPAPFGSPEAPDVAAEQTDEELALAPHDGDEDDDVAVAADAGAADEASVEEAAAPPVRPSSTELVDTAAVEANKVTVMMPQVQRSGGEVRPETPTPMTAFGSLEQQIERLRLDNERLQRDAEAERERAQSDLEAARAEIEQARAAAKAAREEAAAAAASAAAAAASGEDGGSTYSRERELLSLREVINKKEREILDLKDDLDAKERQILDQKDKVRELERKARDMDEKFLHLERELVGAKERLEALEADKQSLVEREAGVKKRLDSAKEEIEKSHAESDELRARLDDELKKAEEQRVAELEQAAADKKTALETQAAEHEQALADKIEEHGTELQTLRDKHDAELQELRSSQAQEVEQLRAQGEKALADRDAAHEQALQQAKQEHDEALAAKQAEHEEAQKALTAEHEGAQQKAATAHSAALEAMQQQHERAVAEAEAQHAEAKATLESEHAEAKATLEREHAEALAEAKQRHEEESAAQAKAHEETMAEAKKRHEEESAAQAKAHEDAMAEQKSTHEAAEAALRAEHAEVKGELEGTVAARDESLSQANAAIADRDRQIGEYEQKIDQLDGQLLDAYKKIRHDEQLSDKAQRALAIAITLLEEQKNVSAEGAADAEASQAEDRAPSGN